jgi:hypothetical protein
MDKVDCERSEVQTSSRSPENCIHRIRHVESAVPQDIDRFTKTYKAMHQSGCLIDEFHVALDGIPRVQLWMRLANGIEGFQTTY